MAWIESRNRYRKRVTIDGKTHDIYGTTQDEVRERIRELERMQTAGIILGDKTKLYEFAQEWYPVKAAGLSHNAASVYRNTINNHICPFFGNMLIADVKPFHIEKLIAEKSMLSKSAQAKILFSLSQIMETAVRNGLIAKNPCDGIKAGGEAAKEKVPLSDNEQAVLLEAVHGTRAELFTMLCLFAGLRKEEALGLLWSSVHIDNDTPYIEIKNTVTFHSNQPIHSDKLKSKSAKRNIPIPPQLTTALKTAQQSSDSLFVVSAVNSKGAMSAVAFRRMWEIATKAVSFHVHPHLLRHTYITTLCASGLDIKKIQYLAGHKDISMTLRIYTHVKNNTPADLSKDIVKIFSGSVSGSGMTVAKETC